MDALLKLLEGETIFGVSWSMIILAIAAFFYLRKKYNKWIDSELKKRQAEELRDKNIQKSLNEVKKLQETHAQDRTKYEAQLEQERQDREATRIHDRNQSFEIQRQLTEAIQRIEEKQDTFAETQQRNMASINELFERSRKYELASSREKLLHSYLYYTNPDVNPRLEWTELESEAFWELFNSYTENGGNSFMHKNVEPEMRKLIIVDMEDLDSVTKLMESRKRTS